MSLARAFKIRDRVVIKRKGKAAEYIVTEDK